MTPTWKRLLRAILMRRSNVWEHIANPDHSPELIEDRAFPLVHALESRGARVFASCAGHGITEGQAPDWPHFAFRCESPLAKAVAALCHDNPPLNYQWELTGHLVPRFDFDITYAFSAGCSSGVWKYRRDLVDADIAWLADFISNRMMIAPVVAHPSAACHGGNFSEQA